LLIELGKGVLCFTQLTRGGGNGLFLLFKLGEQGGALLLLLTYRTLFGGDKKSPFPSWGAIIPR